MIIGCEGSVVFFPHFQVLSFIKNLIQILENIFRVIDEFEFPFQ